MARRLPVVVYDDDVPAEERLWITRLVRRAARVWSATALEYHISVGDLGDDDLGTCKVEMYATASFVKIMLNRARLAERSCVRVDLVHELLHVFDGEVRQSAVDL